MILGLDISSSIIGYAILDDNGNQIKLGFINLKKYKSLFEKVFVAEEELKKIKKEIIQDNQIEIRIEQSLQMFKSGFSSAKTLSLLSKMNGIVSYLCYQIFLSEPIYVSASSARKKCGITVEKGKIKAKEQVMNFFIDKGFQPEYTRTGKVKSEFFDMIDAFVIANSGVK